MNRLKNIINSKGFNLFSSVVAAILLMTGIVLVNTLISTEEKTNNQIYYMVNSFKLNDAATLARADALQNFNYYFRESMENWLTFSESGIINDGGWPIVTTDNCTDWNEIKGNFEKVVLLVDNNVGRKFDAAIDFVASKTVDQFSQGSYGKYHVTLSDTGPEAKANIKAAINETLSNASARESFLEVVGCEENDCQVGTFYFSIPLDQISDEKYEKLPRIIVRDIITSEEIRIAILPKTKLRIYIPIRFFKAVWHTKEQAKIIKNLENDYLAKARSGFCDASSCVPRSDLLRATTGNWIGNNCPADSGDAEQTLENATLSNVNSYKLGGALLGAPLNAYSRSIICSDAISAGIGNTGDPKFLNNNYDLNGNTKGLVTENFLIRNCPFASIDVSPYGFVTKTIESRGTVKLYCNQIESLSAEVVFEETNPSYIVSGPKLYYKIKINTKTFSKSPAQSGVCTDGTSTDKKCSVSGGSTRAVNTTFTNSGGLI
ncbi:MAG TPA: hypothetical protein PKK60_02910 [archaeon]|nr:hypothetical protein [archaeon]